ncbi:MAG TPA: hypothetical protein VLT45_14515 [Kofleriaceae bacterium]|nr:hypothetical protein [Kofleriaceae bacterium]
MRPSVLALILSVAVATSCLVSARSDKLACTTTSDCTSPRVCEGGYCVVDVNACPALCDGGCGSDGSCNITGTGGDSITCPSGKTCNITCVGGACGSITCTEADKCTIMCVGDSACGPITCGTADCIITCEGTNACDNITCGSRNSGRCRVGCTGTNACSNISCSNTCDCVIDGCSGGTCGALTCPRAGGSYCTGTGNNGDPCIDTTSGCSC